MFCAAAVRSNGNGTLVTPCAAPPIPLEATHRHVLRGCCLQQHQRNAHDAMRRAANSLLRRLTGMFCAAAVRACTGSTQPLLLCSFLPAMVSCSCKAVPYIVPHAHQCSLCCMPW